MSPILRHDLRWCVQQSRAPRLRTMRQFAEQEIVTPDGPFEGRRFRCDRQPYTGLWLDAVDSGRWNRIVSTGPTQSGKTLCCFILPLLYHLFEIGETVICGLPDMDMAGDKWREDILPVIEQSRYRELLPRQGTGRFIAGTGLVTRWEQIRPDNHWFDATYNACAAGHMAGVRLIEEVKPTPPQQKRGVVGSFVRRDGSPWINLERWNPRW